MGCEHSSRHERVGISTRCTRRRTGRRRGQSDDWALAEPRWDPEATVGASDGLIERIRQEVRATPARPVTTPDEPAGAALPAVETPTAATAPSVDDLTSTTVRWEPRQRLAATAPVTDTVLIAPPTHQGLDKTKVVIALIVAVALVIVVWLVVGSRGSDDPAPTVGSVPTSDGTDSSLAPSGSAPPDTAPVEVGG